MYVQDRGQLDFRWENGKVYLDGSEAASKKLQATFGPAGFKQSTVGGQVNNQILDGKVAKIGEREPAFLT